MRHKNETCCFKWDFPHWAVQGEEGRRRRDYGECVFAHVSLLVFGPFCFLCTTAEHYWAAEYNGGKKAPNDELHHTWHKCTLFRAHCEPQGSSVLNKYKRCKKQQQLTNKAKWMWHLLSWNDIIWNLYWGSVEMKWTDRNYHKLHCWN